MMILLLAALLASDVPATTQPAETPELAAKPKKVALICRKKESVGSRMAKRECHTADEWDRILAGKNAGDLKTLGAR